LGFNYAVKYVSPLLFSTVPLLDPILTGGISWAWGLEGVPSWSTFLGGGIVMIGIGIVVISEHRRKVREEDQQRHELEANVRAVLEGTDKPPAQNGKKAKKQHEDPEPETQEQLIDPTKKSLWADDGPEEPERDSEGHVRDGSIQSGW